MPNLVQLEQLSATASKLALFDFSSVLTNGQTITSATVTASVWGGVDSNPSAIVFGAAVINGLVVQQLLTPRIAGNIYKIKVTAVSSDAQTSVLYAYLAVVEDPL